MAKKNILEGIGDSYDALMGIAEPKPKEVPVRAPAQGAKETKDQDLSSELMDYLRDHPELIQKEIDKRQEKKDEKLVILVPGSLKKRIDKEAKRSGLSRGAWIRKWIEKGLDESEGK